MTNRSALAGAQNQLLREAAEWRLLGLLFECPSPQWRAQVASLAAEIPDAGLKAMAEAARTEASEGLHHSIFGPGGPAPPREVSYCDLAQPGYLLSELSSYYEAFAYQPALREAPDHVSVEAGFVAYLRLKEAYALANSDGEHAAITGEAARQFIHEHLATLAEPLARALEHSGVEYLTAAGSALLARVGPRRAAPQKRGLPVLNDNEETDFTCAEN
ncbi:MAG: molecular chaperone TorD family protein [Blastocatellia bacterium]